jgi:hypothetical protein
MAQHRAEVDPEELRLVEEAASRLWSHCQANHWSGYDPYDGLNSKIFRMVPFLDARLPRLAMTQAIKRCPVNLRPWLLVPRTQNPKGLALFLMALLKQPQMARQEQKATAVLLAGRLEALRSANTPYWCWGYSFPWQTRSLLVPRGAPNLVCTSFVANALLDLYEESGEERYLNMATSAADYILNELYWTAGDSVAGYSYPAPSARSQVHNANFLGSSLLCRVSRQAGAKRFLEPALKVARYSADRQRPDGSWCYGEASTQRWVDNFHTGYNLCALRRIAEWGETSEFDSRIARGFEFYRRHFFGEDGAPRYFHDRTYPLDVHSAAQSVITLLEFKDLEQGNVTLARRVLKWSLENLWDKRGFFYYQKLRYCTIRIPYMRWSQAWMLVALATFLQELNPADRRNGADHFHPPLR